MTGPLDFGTIGTDSIGSKEFSMVEPSWPAFIRCQQKRPLGDTVPRD